MSSLSDMSPQQYFDFRAPLFLQLGFNEKALNKLFNYIDLLWISNTSLNLISRKMSYSELIDNHVLDCLLPLKYFPKPTVVADFGTGGGLPAVIYALQFPNVNFLLFEKSLKKQEFLKLCKVIAPNVEIFSEIPEKLPQVDLVIARAFKPLDVILDLSKKYYLAQGKYFLLKGRKEKIDEEIALAMQKYKNLAPKITQLNSPVLDVQRHVVLIN